jgi:hypothetical protein
MRVSLRYGGSWRTLRILTLESTSVTDGAGYHLEVAIRTEGLVDLLFPWRSRSESIGVLRDGEPVPHRVRSEGTFRRRTYRTALDYLESGDVQVEVDPPPEAPVPEALRRETVDPQTATFALIHRNAAGRPCAGRQHVFDGRLRYEVEFVDGGTATLERSRQAPYAGTARVCEAVIHPRAGFAHAETRTRTILRYWLAPVLDGIPPMPVRIDLSGRRGTLRMDLTDVQASGSS